MEILVHMCCAPCAAYPITKLINDGFSVKGLFYNPNIHPIDEYEIRRKNVSILSEKIGFDVYYDNNYFEDIWRNLDADYDRCRMCYELRLEELFKFAAKKGFSLVTTTLLISPFQNHDLIIEIAKEKEKKHNVTFYYEDFRPFYRKGQEIAKEYGLYRQRYCGCILSLKERIQEIVSSG